MAMSQLNVSNGCVSISVLSMCVAFIDKPAISNEWVFKFVACSSSSETG